MNWEDIIGNIQWYVIDLYIAHRIHPPKGNTPRECMVFFKLSDHPKVLDIKLITWQKPRLNWIKYNVDGVCSGNRGRAGGGGIFRNEYGEMLLAFCEYFGFGTSMLVEALAILHGLKYAQGLNITFLWLELDSLELVYILQGLHRCPWHLNYHLNYIMSNINSLLSSYVWVISHVMRESNQGADALANEALNGEGDQVFKNRR